MRVIYRRRFRERNGSVVRLGLNTLNVQGQLKVMQGIELKATNGIEAEKNELTWGSLDSFLAKLKSEIFCSINNLGNF